MFRWPFKSEVAQPANSSAPNANPQPAQPQSSYLSRLTSPVATFASRVITPIGNLYGAVGNKLGELNEAVQTRIEHAIESNFGEEADGGVEIVDANLEQKQPQQQAQGILDYMVSALDNRYGSENREQVVSPMVNGSPAEEPEQQPSQNRVDSLVSAFEEYYGMEDREQFLGQGAKIKEEALDSESDSDSDSDIPPEIESKYEDPQSTTLPLPTSAVASQAIDPAPLSNPAAPLVPVSKWTSLKNTISNAASNAADVAVSYAFQRIVDHAAKKLQQEINAVSSPAPASSLSEAKEGQPLAAPVPVQVPHNVNAIFSAAVNHFGPQIKNAALGYVAEQVQQQITSSASPAPASDSSLSANLPDNKDGQKPAAPVSVQVPHNVNAIFSAAVNHFGPQIKDAALGYVAKQVQQQITASASPAPASDSSLSANLPDNKDGQKPAAPGAVPNNIGGMLNALAGHYAPKLADYAFKQANNFGPKIVNLAAEKLEQHINTGAVPVPAKVNPPEDRSERKDEQQAAPAVPRTVVGILSAAGNYLGPQVVDYVAKQVEQQVNNGGAAAPVNPSGNLEVPRTVAGILSVAANHFGPQVIDGVAKIIEKKDEKEGKEEKHEMKAEDNVSPAQPSSQPISQAQGAEVVRRLGSSFAKTEAWLRQQMQSFLDPKVYEEAILKGPRNEYGRYTNVTTDKEDPLFYYHHMLNLLISLQQTLVPFADIQETYLELIRANPALGGKLWAMGKKFFSKEGSDINEKVNQLDITLSQFIGDFNTLELDSLPARLPGIKQVLEILNGLSFVQAGKEQFKVNPFVTSYHNNTDHWRQLIGLPNQANIEEKFDEFVRNARGVLVGRADSSGPQMPAEVKRVLEKLPGRVEGMSAAFLAVLRDLGGNGNDLSPEVKKDIEKTTRAVKVILAELREFSGRNLNWRNILNLGYRMIPALKRLLSSMPQTYVSVDRLLRDHLMDGVRQLNFILQECFLYVDRMESHFYLKDGLFYNLGEGNKGCGLLGVDFNPMDPANGERLKSMLGANLDTYILFENKFYYAGLVEEGQLWVEPLEIKPINVAIPSVPLVQFMAARQRGAPEPQMIVKQADSDYLKGRLGITAELEAQQKNNWLFQKLNPGQSEYLRSLTGHSRNARKYDTRNYSLANLAKRFNDAIEAAGYKLPADERYPYHPAIKQQREGLLVEHRKKIGLEDGQSLSDADVSAGAVRLRQLSRRVELREKLHTEAEISQQTKTADEKVRLNAEKRRILKLQIETRIAQLVAESQRLERIWGKWIVRVFTLTYTKQKKIILLHELNRQLQRRAEAGDTVPSVDKALNAMQESFHGGIGLLLQGRTGKMMKTLKALTLTPQDRSDLILKEIARLNAEWKRDQGYLFLSEWRNRIRRAKLEARVEALKQLHVNTEKPGFRLQECLDRIKSKSGTVYKTLIKEAQLIDLLRENDALRPNVDVGKKQFGFFAPLDKRQATVAAPEAAPVAVQQPSPNQNPSPGLSPKSVPGARFFAPFVKAIEPAAKQPTPQAANDADHLRFSS